ncbi:MULTISPECIES: beta strand repeat-containing protein [unclassified Tolypothrix]|uniref:beta strand repeat-containing protein n=1 Tax=unclassified Tolypothrix TaxID=2649714 RepID=UPI0005EAA3FA|nr:MULTISPECIES: S-layer family protein [unclassified Tolypothrix]BAY91294.1 filamentous hemagglutinin outer membrane protein [Microchaete diplosiphon NIES-3275]EKF04585.1 hypothetical protein FDUTEX481_01854 [Tolypothrix sp. PCC 7601]MBE9087180.1 S-layer family protein [Tolypothrix sp. LEGE 11397]UYD25363.1 S-layer family protein [Tolypothrix sp. PCC 7712]UYD32392.1 S-layer family protein [Tolypothrix sp. PCC 7601]
MGVNSGAGGSIAIIARNLTMTGAETQLQAGISADLGTVGAQAGDIDIDATEIVSLDTSRILNAIFSNGIGNTGDIRITTGSLFLANGGLILAATFGQGNTGDITITARDTVSFDGFDSNGFSSAAATQVSPEAIGQGGNVIITTGKFSLTNGAGLFASTYGQGNAGNITITTDTLALTDGAIVSASTSGQGNAGNITITARDTVFMDGIGSDGLSSGAFSDVYSGAIGQGGDISISTGTLYLTNGALVSDSTYGQGNAGNITITARDTVSFDGVNINGDNGGVYSRVHYGAIGQGGNIHIITGNLSLTNGGYIDTSINGQGNAGNITITARDAVSIDGEGSNGFGSSVSSLVYTEATGRGGDITITADSLSFTNGGTVTNSTLGRGNAGDLTLTARNAVSFDGTTKSTSQTSGAGSTVDIGAIGRGGNIRITAGTLSIINGAAVSATTFGQGDAGTVTVTAREAVFIDGTNINGIPSGIFSQVGDQANGQGGKITVNTELFSITNRGELTASSEGQGNAGNLDIMTHQLRLDNQGSIQAQTASGLGGDMTLQVQDLLLLRRGSFISTTAGTAFAGGDGGNITFDGKFIVAIPNENSDISANAFTGTGGNIQINSRGIFGIESRAKLTDQSDITASSEQGISGVINLNTPDNSSIQNSFSQLSPNVIDTNALIANSCIARGSKRQENSFTITGSGALRNSPGDVLISAYSTGDVRNVEPTSRPWKKGDPIIEAQRLYRLPDGRSLLSRACNQYLSQNKRMKRGGRCNRVIVLAEISSS